MSYVHNTRTINELSPPSQQRASSTISTLWSLCSMLLIHFHSCHSCTMECSIDSACQILRFKHGTSLLRYALLLDLSSRDWPGNFGEGPMTFETRLSIMSITAHPWASFIIHLPCSKHCMFYHILYHNCRYHAVSRWMRCASALMLQHSLLYTFLQLRYRFHGEWTAIMFYPIWQFWLAEMLEVQDTLGIK